ncbi:MAG: hypothetical protein YYHSYBAR_002138, partial [Candidatus Fervidibacter sacchari]
MKRFAWLIALSWLVLAPLWAQTNRVVVIVSWDGGKPSVIRQLV